MNLLLNQYILQVFVDVDVTKVAYYVNFSDFTIIIIYLWQIFNLNQLLPPWIFNNKG